MPNELKPIEVDNCETMQFARLGHCFETYKSDMIHLFDLLQKF